MDFLEIIIILFHITEVFTKHYKSSSSDETVENLLYYKDCQRNPPPTTAPPPPQMRENFDPPPPQYGCPNPKMCCSLSCDNQCDSNSPMMSALNNQRSSMAHDDRHFARNNMMARFPSALRRIKPKSSLHDQPVINALKTFRRDGGLTKEKIKSLISKDDDIRKILRDLVRVTMQKVDLVDVMKNSKNENNGNNDSKNSGEE